MRAMKCRHLAVFLESNPRAPTLDEARACGQQQPLDRRPFKFAGDRLGKDGGKGLAMRSPRFLRPRRSTLPLPLPLCVGFARLFLSDALPGALSARAPARPLAPHDQRRRRSVLRDQCSAIAAMRIAPAPRAFATVAVKVSRIGEASKVALAALAAVAPISVVICAAVALIAEAVCPVASRKDRLAVLRAWRALAKVKAAPRRCGASVGYELHTGRSERVAPPPGPTIASSKGPMRQDGAAQPVPPLRSSRRCGIGYSTPYRIGTGYRYQTAGGSGPSSAGLP